MNVLSECIFLCSATWLVSIAISFLFIFSRVYNGCHWLPSSAFRVVLEELHCSVFMKLSRLGLSTFLQVQVSHGYLDSKFFVCWKPIQYGGIGTSLGPRNTQYSLPKLHFKNVNTNFVHFFLTVWFSYMAHARGRYRKQQPKQFSRVSWFCWHIVNTCVNVPTVAFVSSETALGGERFSLFIYIISYSHLVLQIHNTVQLFFKAFLLKNCWKFC